VGVDVKEAAVVAVLAMGLVFVGVLLGTLFGAFAGWVVGLIFDETLTKLSALIGFAGPHWQLGAMLGFVGGFFRTSVSKESKS
jgi:ABC-type dipeptide/oligopeptide/nickel transport system permease component